MMRKWVVMLAQTCILAGLTGYLLSVLINGNVSLYINSRFIPLVYIAVFLLAAILVTTLLQIYRLIKHQRLVPAGPSWFELGILCVPLCLGFLAPATPLASAAIDARGLNFYDPQSFSLGVNQTVTSPQDERTILDWYSLFAADPELVSGEEKHASVVGFVYHDDRLAEDQFYINRFIVTCCAADAFPIGILVQWPASADLASDSWVHITGEIGTTTLNGSSIPLITAESVELVAQPDQPYLFP